MVNQRMFLFQGEDLRWFETQSETQTSKNIAIAYHQLRPGSVVLSTECYGRPGPRQFGVLNNPRNVPSDGLKNSHIYEVLTGGVVRFYIDCDWYRNGHESYNADLPDDDELVLQPLVNAITPSNNLVTPSSTSLCWKPAATKKQVTTSCGAACGFATNARI